MLKKRCTPSRWKKSKMERNVPIGCGTFFLSSEGLAEAPWHTYMAFRDLMRQFLPWVSGVVRETIWALQDASRTKRQECLWNIWRHWWNETEIFYDLIRTHKWRLYRLWPSTRMLLWWWDGWNHCKTYKWLITSRTQSAGFSFAKLYRVVIICALLLLNIITSRR